MLPTLTARLLEAIKALRRHFAPRRRPPQPYSAASLEQRLLQPGVDYFCAEDVAESSDPEGVEGTEMNDMLASALPIGAPPHPDAVRGFLRDFGQYLRERGEEAPADWS